MRRILLIVVVAALAIVAGVWFGRQVTESNQTQQALQALMDSRLPDTAGQQVALSQWQDKPLLVNFWGTWCAPCREEMPLLNTTAEHTPGVQFVGVAIDEPSALAEYAANHHTSYPLLQGNSDLMALTGRLGNTAQALPFSVLVGADGNIRRIKLGAFGQGELDDALRDLTKAR